MVPLAGVVAGTLSAMAGAAGTAAMSRQDCITALPLEARVGQVLLAMSTTPAGALDAVQAGRVTGWAPIGNVDVAQLPALRSTTARNPIPPLLAADEEGGLVQRFSPPLDPLPDAATLAASATDAEVRSLFAAHGSELRRFGLSLVFAPVADVGGAVGIGERSFGQDPATVSRFARAVADGYLAAGLTPVFKHFPGHGRASGDTHVGAATVPPLEQLRTVDLVPFVDAVATYGDRIGIMIGHLAVPGLTGDEPASVSPAAITGLLRDDLGFRGLVVSDSFDMGAIRATIGPAEAVRRFLAAGGDLAVIHAVDIADVHRSVTDAVRSATLSGARLDEAAGRVLRLKGVDPCSLGEAFTTVAPANPTETTELDGAAPATTAGVIPPAMTPAGAGGPASTALSAQQPDGAGAAADRADAAGDRGPSTGQRRITYLTLAGGVTSLGAAFLLGRRSRR